MRVRVCYSILSEKMLNTLLPKNKTSCSRKQITFCLEDKMLSKAAIQIALTRRYPLRNNSWLFASQSTLTWVTRHGTHDEDTHASHTTVTWVTWHGIHDDTHTIHTTIVIQKSKKKHHKPFNIWNEAFLRGNDFNLVGVGIIAFSFTVNLIRLL